MKHKHYDMIVAKAANVDLVVFIKMGDKWEVIGSHENQIVNFGSHYDYFLCLPQHKEACLHWLNGGDSQSLSGDDWFDILEWKYLWGEASGFMRKDLTTRIKPKKEKRWIAFNSKSFMVTRDTYTTGVKCEDALNKAGEIYESHPWQFIEIEIEVKD